MRLQPRFFFGFLLLCSIAFPAKAVTYKLQPVADGFASPVGVEKAPGDATHLYVVEQRGTIRTIENGQRQATPFLDITKQVIAGGERGLLGLAFHPQYASNKKFYVNYTANRPNLKTILGEYKAGSKAERVLLTYDQPYVNHNGGGLAFDAQGLLYIASGDGGSAEDPHNHGQNKHSLLGKILRIGVDASGGLPYTIPQNNPFLDGTGAKEVYAYGLRNPWRITFDRTTGNLFTGDVGQYLWEEIDRIDRGGNYGWRLKEGNHCFNPPENCDKPGLIGPLFEYPRSEGISITGGYVYRGSAMPELQGAYIYGDYGSGKIWALTLNADQTKAVRNDLLVTANVPISSFGEDHDGEILVVSHHGSILRLAR